MQSIIQTTPGKKCCLCDHMQYLEKHHCIHGNANRKLADQDGLWIWLCQFCHRIDRTAVHGPEGKLTDLKLKQDAERAWLDYYGKSIPDWIARYGKNYL